MSKSTPVLVATAAVARAAHWGTADDERAARQNLSEVRVARAIQDAINAAPPLTAEARERLAELLKTGAGK